MWVMESGGVKKHPRTHHHRSPRNDGHPARHVVGEAHAADARGHEQITEARVCLRVAFEPDVPVAQGGNQPCYLRLPVDGVGHVLHQLDPEPHPHAKL